MTTDDAEMCNLINLQQLLADMRDEHAHSPFKRAMYAECAMGISRLAYQRATELAREQMAVTS